MFKKLVIIVIGLALGVSLGYLLISRILNLPKPTLTQTSGVTVTNKPVSHEVWGFLPYWFLDTAKPSYKGTVTNLVYFSLTPDSDGTILKYTAPGESEPGFYALTGGKFDSYLETAKADNIKLSLAIFDGDQDRINALISDPVVHADTLMNELAPIITQYGFSDLNMDLEGVGVATPSAQANYEAFIKEVHTQIKAKNLNITLSMDIIPVDFIRQDHLGVPANLVQYLDKVIIMAYDFHSPSSFVTGPVAPLYGAGTVAEFDTQVAVEAAMRLTTSDKILVGAPFYGYSWETLGNYERAAVVPSSAFIESSKDVEELLASCASCSAYLDDVAQEHYIIYKNEDTGTYQQIFYPDATSIQSKLDFVKGNNLGGLAIWALGYEGNDITTPIQKFLLNH